jgi:Recombinase zinc beta ribbon domain
VKKETDENGRVYEVRHVRDRLHDADVERYPIAPETMPPLVTAEQFLRIQQKLKDAAALKNRGRHRGENAPVTLLDGGFIRCAECGDKMTRYYHRSSKKPYYRCNKTAGVPDHPHKPHAALAWPTDSLVLRLFAEVLIDPQIIADLAEAAEGQAIAAEAQAELSAAAIAACDKRLAEIILQQDELVTVLEHLSRVPGMEAQVSDIRAKLRQLDRDAEETTAQQARTIPHHDTLLRRHQLLTQLTEIWQGAEVVPDLIDPGLAAKLFGVPLEELDRVLDWHSFIDEAGGLLDISRVEVVEQLLRNLPRERLRNLLREFGAVVRVSRPRTRAQWANEGPTPLEDRVSLELLGQVSVRIDASNISTSGSAKKRAIVA